MGQRRTQAAPTRSATILVVDDEDFVRELLTGFLSTLGHVVHEASSGEEGVRRATERRYDIVFTDIKMPGITGIEVLQRVKAIDPSTQVIVITGYGSVETAVECMKLGAFDYIGKPFHLDEIGILVGRALEHGDLQALVGLYRLSQSVFSTVRFDELLDRIIELTVQVLRADEASIMLFDERGRLYIAASTGLDDEITRTTRVELYEPIAGRVAADGRPLILGDEINARHGPDDRRTMISSSIVHPIITRNKTFGILNVNRIAMPEQFTRADLEKATIFVSHIAQAIENAKLFEELERRVEELNRANDQLEYRQRQVIQAEKLSAIGNLVAGVAHELNNPLTAVMGFSEFLLLADCQGEIKQTLTKIHGAANRCRKIIQNLLSFSREQESRQRTTDLHELVADVLEFAARGLADHGIETVTDFERNLPHVSVDPDRMKQVVLGMVHNAMAAMDEQPERRLSVATRSHRGRVYLTVTDTGCGIPEEHLTKVFDPFFTTREVGQGVGLGLSTCYAVVERFGGTVRVESELGCGTTFTIELPVLEPVPVDTQYVPLETDGTASCGRVLVIEDEDDLCLMYEAALKQDGYDVVLASNGAAGIEALSRGEYDVIVLDMKMPGTDGGDICAFIESNCPQMMKRVLFATGDTVSERTHWWIERTGQPVLNKPFRVQDLLDAVAGVERAGMPG
jgi:signal transduction histidine kinase/DNA-binding response OmpR family regulator